MKVLAGENEIINKFGLEIRDDTTLVLSKRRFEEHVANKATLTALIAVDQMRDIVFVPLLKSYFEILFVEDIRCSSINLVTYQFIN